MNTIRLKNTAIILVFCVLDGVKVEGGYAISAQNLADYHQFTGDNVFSCLVEIYTEYIVLSHQTESVCLYYSKRSMYMYVSTP